MHRLFRHLLLLLPILLLALGCSGPDTASSPEPTATPLAATQAPSTATATSTSTVPATDQPAPTPAEPTATSPEPAPTATATATEIQPTASTTTPTQARPSPAADEPADTATLQQPTPSRPEDQRIHIPDVDAWYQVHITELNVDTGFVRASQLVTLPDFRGPVPDRLYFQVVPAGYGFFTLDEMRLNGEPIAPETINGGYTLVVDLPDGASAPLEVGFDFHLQVGAESSGWGYTALDADVLRLGYWFPLLSDDHGFSHNLDPAYLRAGTFDVTLDIEPGVSFAHSGEIVNSEELGDGRTRYAMHADRVRDFDLVLSRSFTRQTAVSESGVRIEYYWREGISPDYSAAVLNWTADAIDQLTSLIGPYPWETLRVADAGPSMPGGIEFGNLIYINPAYPTLDRLIYHEVGHQWLYGIIGTRTLEDGWIDEGGAEFFERGLPTGFSEVPAVPEGGYQHPLDASVDELPQTGRSWYYSIYEQGARFYYAVMDRMGWGPFWTAMQDLYQTYQFEIVTAYDLLKLWQQHSETDLRPLYDEYFRYDWIDELPPPGVTTRQGWIPLTPVS